MPYVNKEDQRAACRKHYRLNKDYYLNRNRRHKKRTQEEINKAKDNPCVDCKHLFPPECMDFDHVRGKKKFNIGGSFAMSLKVIRVEIKKCDLVCANCHRIRTKKRQQAAGVK